VAIDMSQYMDIFLDESKEHLTILNEHLLELEKNAGNIGSLNEIFRAAHTLKGMSSTMGFEDVADLTHHMENVLSALKEGILDVDSQVVDVLFQCFDRMQCMIDKLESSGSSSLDNNDLINMLEAIRNGNFHEPIGDIPEDGEQAEEVEDEDKPLIGLDFNSFDITIIKEALSTGNNIFYARISVNQDCMMKAVRAFMVFKSIEEDGEIIKSFPHVQDLDEGKFDSDFELLFVSNSDLEAVNKRISKISEITSLVTRFDESMITSSQADSKREELARAEKLEISEETDTADIKHTPKARKTVRVDIDRLDMLMNLVGELVMHKGCLEQIGATNKIPQLNETIEQMDRISADLQSVVMIVRMVPIEQVFNRFPRMVRDLAKDLNKEIDFIMEGKDTELDRTVIDEIGDPLVHLLRNALDHGIELPEERIAAGKPGQGTLILSARHEGNNVYIDVQDDGKGIDSELVLAKAIEKGIVTRNEAQLLTDSEIHRFIFAPGFSTSSQVTDISGRGVGLDVVKTKIESINGEISIETKPGQGTKFRIKLPLTLAIIQALMVSVKDEIYAIPLSSVNETSLINKSDIKVIQNQEVIILRGDVLPLFRLNDILDVPGEDRSGSQLYVVVVRKGEHQIGLVVDTLIGQQEIVIKSLGKILLNIPGIAGAIVAGDGNVRLIIDIASLF